MATIRLSGDKARIHYGWIVLGMGTLVVFGSLGLGRFAYSVVLPSMQSGLHMDNTQAGALATANLAGYLAFCVIGGALASRFGPRLVIACGLALAAIAMMMTATVHGLTAAIVWRALTGIGSGASNVPTMGLLSSWFAARRRGLATGIGVAGSSIALIVTGPLVPRILAVHPTDGWRACWLIFGAATMVLAIAAALILRNRPSDVGQRPVGAHIDCSPASSGSSRLTDVYTRPIVWLLGLVYVAFGFSYIIYMTFFAKCLMSDAGYTQPQAGHLFMIMGWFSLFCGLIWGSVSDSIGRKGALAIVYVIQAAAFALFALRDGPPCFVASAILFGLTAWSIPGIMAATCGDLLGAKLAPAALGFITLFFGIGQAAAPYVAGAMADAAHSFSPAFWLCTGVALLGAVGALLLPLKREHTLEKHPS